MELKPCPFCGGEAKKIKKQYGDGTAYAWITCINCQAETEHFKQSLDYGALEEAIKAWNKRVEDVIPISDFNEAFSVISKAYKSDPNNKILREYMLKNSCCMEGGNNAEMG